MTERTTVRLPEDLVRRAKKKALAEGRSLTALIEDGLRKVLDEHGQAGRRKRVLPPVSSGKGGLTPGINLDDSAALQELEDLSGAGRLR
jgi:Arc/MetJ-type ribon-helix-helix transcriptional regulator